MPSWAAHAVIVRLHLRPFALLLYLLISVPCAIDFL